jgi:hypothetical protein
VAIIGSSCCDWPGCDLGLAGPRAGLSGERTAEEIETWTAFTIPFVLVAIVVATGPVIVSDPVEHGVAVHSFAEP